MEIIKPRTLSGFMELLPGKQIQFERMVEILRNTYSSYGFADDWKFVPKAHLTYSLFTIHFSLYI